MDGQKQRGLLTWGPSAVGAALGLLSGSFQGCSPKAWTHFVPQSAASAVPGGDQGTEMWEHSDKTVLSTSLPPFWTIPQIHRDFWPLAACPWGGRQFKGAWEVNPAFPPASL